MRVVVVDAGPLVALFDTRDEEHAWAVGTLKRLSVPIVTCDAVLAETCFLLSHDPNAVNALVESVERGLFRSAFELQPQVRRVRGLMQRYVSVPMSFADACLVRMTELHPDVHVWTLDSDFRIYRRHGRQAIPTIMPSE